MDNASPLLSPIGRKQERDARKGGASRCALRSDSSLLNEIRLTQLMLGVTLIACLLFTIREIQLGIQAASAGAYWFVPEDGLFVSIVGFLIYGNVIYQFARIGYLKRLTAHQPADPKELEDFLYKQAAPPLTILVPSYKEDVHVINQTLLSAALQEYPHRRVVLLIDDPPSSDNWENSMKLIAARNAPYKIHMLLSEQDKRLRSAWHSFAARLSQGRLDRFMEMARLAALYEEVALWFKRQAETYPRRDHTDEFFVQHIFLQPFHEFWGKAQALQTQAAVLSPQEMDQEYQRLAWLFHVELSSFERKKYRNLSHEPNKAMNLNSYMGLLGKSFQEIHKDTGCFLEEVTPSPNALHIPDAHYLITLDADSLLLPKYALRLIYLMEQPGNENIAVAQTPYSAIPNASRLIERIAGATTDIQYLLHQGFTYYQATFWVGANAVLRKAALEDIRQTTREGDVAVTRYIQDRTVIEDTESTIDLIEKGWQLHNYPERLAYSATPPDFGALLIQRRRWANGGLLILPKLVRFLLRKPHRFHTLVEGMMRLHYLISIGAASLGTLLLLFCPFDKSLNTIWLPLTAVPYYVLYGRDLVKMGYRKSDLFAVYALNFMLIPIHLGGVFMSLYQAVTGKKIPFGRTPKVKERTCAPKRYILLELTLLPYCLFACIIDLLSARFDHALYSALNAIAFFYIFTWFIGWKESKEDVFRPRAARHRGAESTMSARSSGAKILGSKAIHLVAGLAALYERKGENATPFPLACLTSIHFSFPFRRSVLFPTAPLLAQQRPTPSARKLGVLTSVLLTLLVKLGVLIVGVLVLLVLGGVGTNVAVSFGGGQSLPAKTSPPPAMSSPIAEATALLAGMAPSSPHLAEAPTECRASTRSCTSKAGRLASCTLNSRHRLSGSMAACNYPQRF